MKNCILEIHVLCKEPIRVKGTSQEIVMIPFEGTASGPLFSGQIIGPGVDTQRIDPQGTAHLSARYILEGTDASGTPCRVFIENQGVWGGAFFPAIVTDSALLKAWETGRLTSTVEGAPGGVTVRIWDDG